MIQRLLPFFTLIALFIGLSMASPNFLTSTNLSSVVRQTAVINIMALGMTLIIISGGIDLSVGSILALAGLLGTKTMEQHAGIPTGMLIGLPTGAFCGFANGVMITSLRINPFIVTLGTMGIFRGLALIISKACRSTKFPRPSRTWAKVLCWVFRSCCGFFCFAPSPCTCCWSIRGWDATLSPSAAIPMRPIYAGVPVRFHTIAVYSIAGLLTGLAGMIEASRLMTGQPTGGQGYELQAIAAVVIGGGSLRGGEGSVLGTLMGAFIMGLLSNGSDLLGTNPYWQQVIIGAVIILAVSVDELRKRRLPA